MLWLMAAAALSAHHTPPPATDIYLYTARRDRNMQVVVDVNADRTAPDTPSLVVFFYYAAKVQGRDLWVNNFQFDCAKGTAALMQSAGETRDVERISLKDVAAAPYVVPAGSLMSTIMGVACRGAPAIPHGWTPTRLNPRQLAKAYYEDYLAPPQPR